jgi:RHS repeat-associated protein
LYSGGSWSWLGDDIFLGRQRIAQVNGSGTRYFHVDHLGSVRRVSTGAGALEKAYDFYPYGLPVPGSAGQERLWFASYELEHQNTSDYTDDLYFLHARWYFPYMGRFLSADPVRGDPAQPQSLNLFAYVTDNPLNFVAPWGLASEVPGNAGTVTTPDGRTCTPTAVDRWTCGTLDDSTVVGPAPVDLRQYSSTQDLKNYYAWLAMQQRAAFSGSTITAHGFGRLQQRASGPDPTLAILGEVGRHANVVETGTFIVSEAAVVVTGGMAIEAVPAVAPFWLKPGAGGRLQVYSTATGRYAGRAPSAAAQRAWVRFLAGPIGQFSAGFVTGFRDPYGAVVDLPAYASASFRTGVSLGASVNILFGGP